MTLHIGVGSAWKKMGGEWIGVSGAWKVVAKKWIGVGGAWKKFYDNLNAYLASLTVSYTAISPNNAYAGIRVDNDGYVYSCRLNTYTQRYQWILGGTAAQYECRYTTDVGTDALTTGVSGTWYSLASDVEFGVLEASNTNATTANTGVLEIRMAAAPNTVFASANFGLTAVVEV